MTGTAVFLIGIGIGVFGTVFAEAMLCYIGYKSKQFDDINDERIERRCG